MAATADSVRLRAVAERIVAALPATVVEAVLTGSVSRGVADVEMLLVTEDALPLDECFGLAGAAGLESLDTWGPRGGRTSACSASWMARSSS